MRLWCGVMTPSWDDLYLVLTVRSLPGLLVRARKLAIRVCWHVACSRVRSSK